MGLALSILQCITNFQNRNGFSLTQGALGAGGITAISQGLSAATSAELSRGHSTKGEDRYKARRITPNNRSTSSTVL